MGEFTAWNCDSCGERVVEKKEISGGILIFDDIEELMDRSGEEIKLLFKEKNCWLECCWRCKWR